MSTRVNYDEVAKSVPSPSATNAAVVLRGSISALALLLLACSEHPTKVEFFTVMELDTAHEFSSSERRTIATLARQATTDVRSPFMLLRSFWHLVGSALQRRRLWPAVGLRAGAV